MRVVITPHRALVVAVTLAVGVAAHPAAADSPAADSPAAAASPAPATVSSSPATATRQAEPAPYRGALGVMVSPITPRHRSMLGAPPSAGVVVRRVLPGSVAEVAGVRRLDVIIDVAGITTEATTDIRRALTQLFVGDLLLVQVIRKRKPVTLFATLSAPHREDRAVTLPQAPATASLEGRVRYLGAAVSATVRTIDQELEAPATRSGTPLEAAR